ncbi:hypothetical protein C8J57DRAFT_1246587 [Mycena rebaudengoi]|nr:hypothetical protein C8J57DRAFT_1246587 [Mycena rebaudengoi]
MEEEGIKRVEEQKRGAAAPSSVSTRLFAHHNARGVENVARGPSEASYRVWVWEHDAGGTMEEGKETGRKKIRQRKEEKERAGQSVSIHESSSLTPYKVGVGTATKLAQDERPRRAAGAPTGRFTSGTASPSSF